LYNSARALLISRQVDGDDIEAVKTCRDHFIYENFEGRTYKELSFDELKYAVYLLNNNQTGNARRGSITHSQLSMLKFYIIGVGIIYSDFSNFRSEIDGYVVDSEEARTELLRKFNNKEKLPASIISYMYKAWINPKCNQWLLEGGYKRYIKNPEMLYYEQLSTDEANYLVRRFMQMWNELNKRNSESHVYDYSKN